MKTTFRILPLAFVIAFFFIQCEKEKPDPKVEIPDVNFLNALIESGIDTNGDGNISPAEAAMVTFLSVSHEDISDMTGIEAFINLDSLVCQGNQLTSLDVSKNTALSFLVCGWNQLTSLDVSKNTQLEMLDCWINQLTSLDVSNNNALTYLLCSKNQLTSLDVSKNTQFEWLDCSVNQLTSLDVSSNNALIVLSCYRNQLTSLDVSNNSELRNLACGENQLTSLDVSNSISLEQLDIVEMPLLHEVCVWEIPFPPDGVQVFTTGSPKVYYTTECSK